jgi:hypothetical protein
MDLNTLYSVVVFAVVSAIYILIWQPAHITGVLIVPFALYQGPCNSGIPHI